jgi:HSP20 family molecular chaperone IbpA
MWTEALQLLDRADRLHRQFFLAHEPASWEPPVDVAESGGELRLQLALPGVAPDALSIASDPTGITIAALRGFPYREPGTYIHRLEIPYGRFQRRIELPLDGLKLANKSLQDGILTLTFRRKEGA